MTKKLGDIMPDADWPVENRSFGQQMSDLGVDVVRPKVSWYKANFQRGKVLGDKISINKNCITLGGYFVDKIGGVETKIMVGHIEKQGQPPAPAFCTSDKKGMTITKTKGQSYRLGTKKMISWLLENGVKLGTYELQEIKGGWIGRKI